MKRRAIGDCCNHHTDVIMGARASQITSLMVVYSTVYSGADQRKHQGSASLAFVRGNSPVTGEFTAQMASNAENVFTWWRHHGRRELDNTPVHGGVSYCVLRCELPTSVDFPYLSCCKTAEPRLDTSDVVSVGPAYSVLSAFFRSMMVLKYPQNSLLYANDQLQWFCYVIN